MNCFAISYDLIGPNRDYDKLFEAIKAYGTWARINESLWIIKTNETSVNIRDNLKQVMDNNDKLFVAKLTGDGAWNNLSNEISNWLKNNL